jgi:hypothetical protein
VDRRFGGVTAFRDGKMLSIEIDLDPVDALEGGLRE